MKIAFGFDLHNTIMKSNEAWINAFVRYSGERYKEMITKEVYNKCSRSKMALRLGLDYSQVIEEYHRLVKPDDNMILFLQSLKEKYPVYLLSAASREKVYKDLEAWDGKDYFREVITREAFDKKSVNEWERFLNSRDIDVLIYLGNDIEEDIIKSGRIISFIKGDFLNDLNDLNMLYNRGE